MKIRVTGKGIYGADGEIAVGTELEVAEEPRGWRGRYVVITPNPSEDATPITNPAQEDDSDLDELRDEYAALTGGHADKRWKEETLREKIAEARKGE